MIRRGPLACCLLLSSLAWAPAARAHPVPKDNHDRTLVVRLTPEAVLVDYRLELDEARAARDLPKNEIAKISSRREFYETFTRFSARHLADNLVARLDGVSLTFACARQRYEVLDHLRCEYHFRAPWAPAAGKEHRFDFREGNYDLDDFSQVRLHLAGDTRVTLKEVSAPDEALMGRPGSERKPGDGERVRKASATFALAPRPARGVYKPALPPLVELRHTPEEGSLAAVSAGKPGPATADTSAAKPWREEPAVTAAGGEPADRPHTLLHLLLDTRQGFGVLLMLAAGFGAVHALTPGHGKTLVAAYLVGERGTVWHALVLGLVTTLTHTAAVLALAALLPLFFPRAVPATVQATLGLVGGLLVAGLGLWLLLRRLSGRADHFHLGGGHHHHHGHDHGHHHHHRHHHDHTHHHHDSHEHVHDHGPAEAGRAGWWGLVVRGMSGGNRISLLRSRRQVWGSLVVLGMSGGIVPCWDAIAMLCFAISAQRLWLALPLLLAFSAGLAGVLVAIGVGVVCARNAASARWGDAGRLRPVFGALPLVSAALVTALGLWLCYDSIHAGTP
jgi:nickel/cobalt exporter